ncbi:hypothetical protein AB0M54_24310 [Actinoplanes sp. NPDC051470]|uniref:hypothetical protein n=1 Tax=Actinoplanes sp. NPDC051470 TaxID=3157224 RepID=UPI0034223FAD
MVYVRLEGSLELRRVAASIKAAGAKGLGKEMAAALRKAAAPVQAAIQDSFVESLPRRGGYRDLASKSVKFRASVRSGARAGSVRIVMVAQGKAERRDIRRLDRGELRHPNWGRSRNVRGKGRVPNSWSTTTIPRDFFRRGTDKAADLAEREMRGVLDDFAGRLLKG